MVKQDKRLSKLRNAAKTFPWSELVSLLTQLGFLLHERAGSRVVFEHEQTGGLFMTYLSYKGYLGTI